MIMQKEEKIVVVLLMMALGSLAVAVWMFGDYEQGLTSTSSGKDSRLSVEGMVLVIKETKTGGNLIISLDSTNTPVFVPSSSGAKEIKSKLHPGDTVRITGSPSDFQGSKELKIERAGDLEILKSI